MTRHPDATPVIETERLTLRAFGPEDVADGVVFLMDERTKFMGGPYTRAAAWDHCAGLIGHWAIRGYGLFSMCLKGSDKAIGDCGLLQPGGYGEPELGWGLWRADLEGTGLVHEAATAVRAHAYGALGWTTLVSYVDPENTRSIALARRLGCRPDPEAGLPDLPGWEGTLVYRHPSPAELSGGAA